MSNNLRKKLDIIPCMNWGESWLTKEDVIKAILEQHRECGYTKFIVHYPSAGWFAVGHPPIEVFREGGEIFREIKAALKPYGISLGWWFRMTVNSGPTPGFQRIVRPNGTLPPYSNCPLCPNVRKTVSKSIATFAEIGKPDFIFLEDDFSIGAQTGGMGCFCDAHLAEFSKREGKTYTREELVSVLNERTPEALEINKRWRELMKDSLVGFASAIRAEVDKKSPEISIGHMQPGSSDREGDSTEAVARAMAGPNHTPYARLFSCLYGVESPNNLPEAMFNTLCKKQHTGENFLFYLEGDAWPQSRFFRSGNYMRACMGTVYSYGYDGATFNNTQFNDKQNIEKAYNKMLSKEWTRFDEVSYIAKQCEIEGVNLQYNPFNVSVYGGEIPSWLTKLSLYGIPVTTKDASITFLDEYQARGMDHESVIKAFSKGLFLDGAAAKILYDRGYGEYMGVEVGDQLCKNAYFNTFSADADPFSYEMGGKEVLCKKFQKEGEARHIGASGYGYSPTGVTGRVALKVSDPECEVISELYRFNKEFVTIARTRFENKLGGKVLVSGLVLGAKFRETYHEQRVIQEQMLWCSDDVVFVIGEPDVYTIMNVAKNPIDSGFKGMITLTNLCEDNLESFSVHIPQKWSDASEFLRLGQDGEWYKLNCEFDGATLQIKENADYLDPVYILVK